MQRRDFDVVVIGSGVVGLAAAQRLARAGHDVLLVDRYRPQPPCLKAEKIDGKSIDYLRRLGFGRATAAVLSPLWRSEVYIGERLGDRIRDAVPEWSAPYHELVDALQRDLDPRVEFLAPERVTSLRDCGATLEVQTESADVVSCRLAILATGADGGLARELGLRRRPYWPGGSHTVGFSLSAACSRALFERCDGVTIHLPLAGAAVHLASFFRMRLAGEEVCRANVFLGPEVSPEFRRRFSADPMGELRSNRVVARLLPCGEPVGGAVPWRTARFGELEPPPLARVVCVGDAHSVVDPGVGDGVKKGLADVQVLAARHVPQWFDRDEFSAAAIGRFYGDPVKQRLQRRFVQRVQSLHRLCHGQDLYSWLRRTKRAFWHPLRQRVRDWLGVPPVADAHHEIWEGVDPVLSAARVPASIP